MLSRILSNPWPDVVPGLSEPAAIAIEHDIVSSIREPYLDCPPAAGLDVLLSTFAEVPKAIVTSSYRERLVVPYLRRHGLDHHFSVVVGSEDTDRLKPDPEPVLLALSLLGADRSGAWMVGDSRADIEAARSAGIGSVGLGIRTAGGDHFADSMQALGRLLTAIMTEDEHGAQ
jgi:phosphoglycolate phosphatase-like HAD superfamily hydrolase